MFVANMYVDVYRDDEHAEVYSEYDIQKESQTSLVYRRMPIHITPYRPQTSGSSQREYQTTTHTANTRMNYVLKRGDVLRTATRTFTVDSIEDTDGAFMGNSRVIDLIEEDAAP